jgi:hypothetical protein
MKKTIVISSGGEVMRYKDKLSQICDDPNISIFAFSAGFKFCINELNIYPDYFAFIDPNSAMPALEHICKHKDKIKTKIILLKPLQTELNYNEFIKWYGSTPVGRENNFGGWERFHEMVNEIKEYGLAIEMPCFTLKHMYNNLSQYSNIIDPDVDLAHKDFLKRFSIKEVIIKNQLDHTFNEDKLTSVVLPILDKLKIYNIALIGFDCGGGRYASNLGDKYQLLRHPELKNIKSTKDHVYLPSANRGMEEAKISISKYLPRWIELDRFKITNLVEDKYTFLKTFITYQSIETLKDEIC